MGVDSNVLIFERIKEEMRAGKTVRTAISASFSQGLLDRFRLPSHEPHRRGDPLPVRDRSGAGFRRDPEHRSHRQHVHFHLRLALPLRPHLRRPEAGRVPQHLENSHGYHSRHEYQLAEVPLALHRFLPSGNRPRGPRHGEKGRPALRNRFLGRHHRLRQVREDAADRRGPGEARRPPESERRSSSATTARSSTW